MLQSLFQALFCTSADLLLLRMWNASQRKPANPQPWPYDWKHRMDDPVYKTNLQRLIERSKVFEEARK